MKKLLLLLILFCLPLMGEDLLERTLVSISYRSSQGNTIALIKLSDESIWKWVPDTYSENLLRKWEEGDPVIIKALNHPGYCLQNPNHPLYCPIVSLSFNSYPLFPIIEDYDAEKELITLSDKSQWLLTYDFNKRTLHHWSLGDRIIPIKGQYENFELINLDVPFDNCIQIERSVQVDLCLPTQQTIAVNPAPSHPS